jgi:hypothetical protein
MAIALYFDVHVDHAIAGQLHLRHVDVLTAQEDGADRLNDELLLDRAGNLVRPIVTHDIHFQALDEDWQRQGKPFCGLISRIRCKSRLGSASAIWKSSRKPPILKTGQAR